MAEYEIGCVVVTRTHSHFVSENYPTVRDRIGEALLSSTGLVELRAGDGALLCIDPRDVVLIREER